MFEFGNLFDGMFPMRGLGGQGGFMPLVIPMIGSSSMFPFTTQPPTGKTLQSASNGCGCGSAGNVNVEVDEEMRLRRELNAQLRAAVANEEYEKAAVLRDEIKALESASA